MVAPPNIRRGLASRCGFNAEFLVRFTVKAPVFKFLQSLSLKFTKAFFVTHILLLTNANLNVTRKILFDKYLS